MSNPVISVDSLVARLLATEGADDFANAVTDVLTGARLDENTLRPFVAFSPERYTRHLIHRDDTFDVMALCWSPGQGTPIHNHDGQLGWAFTVEGELECRDYTVNGEADLDLPEEELDGLAVELNLIGESVCTPGGGVSVVDHTQAVHSLTVPDSRKQGVVSFHVYSRPFDSCTTFDGAQRTARRRQLYFDTSAAGHTVRTV